MSQQRGYWQRRMSRRRLLGGAALGSAGLAIAAVVGCAQEQRPKAPAEAGPAAKQPKRGGILVRAGGGAGSWDTRGTSLDPHVVAPVSAQTWRFFYQGLLGYDLRTLTVEPELAQKWELPSPTEYIFRLQPGVRWHNRPPANGRELRAEDVAFSLERIRTPQPLFQHRALLEAVDKIQAVDNATVRVTTKEPDAGLLSNLSGDGLQVLAPEVVEKAGKFVPLPENAVGTGPFLAKSIEERVAAEYARNPDYWKPGRPFLDAVRDLHLADEQTGYAAFLAGQVHVANLPGEEVKRYIARQGPGYTPDWYRTNAVFLPTPNLTRKPMDDARVTRALRLFLDHDEFKTAWAEVWFGRGRHGSVLTPALEDWDLSEEDYTKFIFWRRPKDEAIREGQGLLRAAGISRDNPLKFEIPTSTTSFLKAASELVQAQFRQNSQGAVDPGPVKPFEMPEFLRIQAQGTFSLGVWGFAVATNDVGGWLSTIYHSRGGRNRMRLKDPRVDALIERQRGIFDIQQRKAVVRELVTYMAENSPAVTISQRFVLNAVNPQVRNFAGEQFTHGLQYEGVWLDT